MSIVNLLTGALFTLVAPFPVVAPADAVTYVERAVEADVIVAGELSSGGCPFMRAKPSSGHVVKIWLGSTEARRDDEGRSIIVRLEEQKVYLVGHEDEVFVELKLPLRPEFFHSAFRRMLERLGNTVMRQRLEGEVTEEAGDDGTLRLSALVGGDAGSTKIDVGVTIAAGEVVGGLARELEVARQLVDFEGSSWLSLLPPFEGAVLELFDAVHLPRERVHYRERLRLIEERTYEPELFRPAEGYSKVKWQAVCRQEIPSPVMVPAPSGRVEVLNP